MFLAFIRFMFADLNKFSSKIMKIQELKKVEMEFLPKRSRKFY